MTGPLPCAHLDEQNTSSSSSISSYYLPTQVVVVVETDIVDIKDNLWHTPLTEEEAVELIAQEASFV